MSANCKNDLQEKQGTSKQDRRKNEIRLDTSQDTGTVVQENFSVKSISDRVVVSEN